MKPEERLCAYYVCECKSKDPSKPIPYAAIVNSAATHHYLEGEALTHCTDIRAAQGPTVTVANGGKITPTHQVSVPISTSLSQSA